MTMLLIQEFLKLEEINEEYRSGLDNLLKNEIPNFDWALKRKFNRRYLKYEYYYLFFSNKSSVPIGIAHIMCEEIPLNDFLDFKDSFFIKTIGLKKHLRILSGNIFNLKKSYIFDPMYEKEGEAQLKKIIEKFKSRGNLDIIVMNHRPGVDFHFGQHRSLFHDIWHDTIYKNKNSYQDYITDLPIGEFQKIKELWDGLGTKEEIQIKDYKNFRSIYELYHTDPSFKSFVPSNFQNSDLTLVHSSYTICTNKMHFLGLCIFYKGENKNYFCEIFSSREHLYLLYQYSLRKFYEQEDINRLVFLNLDYFRDTYKDIMDRTGIPTKKRPISISTPSYFIGKKLKKLAKTILTIY